MISSETLTTATTRMKGNQISFGKYALQALESSWIASRQLEAGRRAISGNVRRHGRRGAGKLWVRIFPDQPMTAKAPGTRMGRGKGATAYLAASVKPGRILYEIGGVTEEIARKAISIAASKLPIRAQFILSPDRGSQLIDHIN